MNFALLIQYLPSVMSLFSTIQTIHTAMPANAQLTDKVAAVEQVIGAAHATAVQAGATTQTFDAFYGPIQGFVNGIVGALHGTSTTVAPAPAADPFNGIV
jgi:hypothetical protein